MREKLLENITKDFYYTTGLSSLHVVIYCKMLLALLYIAFKYISMLWKNAAL